MTVAAVTASATAPIAEKAGDAAYGLSVDGELGDKPRVLAVMVAAFEREGWTGTAADALIGDAVDGFDTRELSAAKATAAGMTDPWAEWQADHVGVAAENDAKALRALLQANRPAADATDLLAQAVTLTDLDQTPGMTFLPTPSLGGDLFYDRALWTISGHKKSGKSWAMMLATMDVLAAGRHVVYVDFENGEQRFKRRLRDQAIPAEHLTRLHYVGFPQGLTTAGLGGQLLAIAERYPDAFVVFDSYRGLFARLSTPAEPLRPNEPTHVERVLGPLIEAVNGPYPLTIGVIDHAVKGGTENDEYSTGGSQAKEAAVDAVYFWTKVHAYSKDVVGVVKIKATSDRDGDLQLERQWTTGGQGDGQPLALKPMAADASAAGMKALAATRQFFQLAENVGERFTKSAVRDAVKGDAKNVDAALAIMLTEDAATFFLEKQPRDNYPKYVWDPDRVLE